MNHSTIVRPPAHARRLGLSEGRVVELSCLVYEDLCDLGPGREVLIWHRGPTGVPHNGSCSCCETCGRQHEVGRQR